MLWLVAIVLGAVMVLAVTVDVPVALRVLAGALAVCAVFRILDVSDDSPLVIRGRTVDVLMFVSAALVVFLLAPAGSLA